MPDERLWAPWRLEYIREGTSCSRATPADDASVYTVHRGERVCSMRDAFPYNDGHAAYERVRSIDALDEASAVDHAVSEASA